MKREFLDGLDGTYVELFLRLRERILNFQRTPEEGNELFAQLLEWTAGQIAYPYRAELQRQEVHNPELIYGVQTDGMHL